MASSSPPPLATERAKNCRELVERFLRREIDWATLRNCWTSEPWPEYEPSDPEAHLRFVEAELPGLRLELARLEQQRQQVLDLEAEAGKLRDSPSGARYAAEIVRILGKVAAVLGEIECRRARLADYRDRLIASGVQAEEEMNGHLSP